MAIHQSSHNAFIQDDILPQPVMLSRSDAILPFSNLSPPSSVASDELDTTKKQEKRKWDSTFDHYSMSNIQKISKQDQLMDDSSQESEDEHSISSTKKPGRKPLADEEFSDDDDPKVKRKAQNRAAQRAFRERKERYVKELEGKLKMVQDAHTLATNQLYQENQHLKSIIYRLEAENMTLKSIHIQQGTLSGKPLHEWVDFLFQQQQQQSPSSSTSIQQQYPFSILNSSTPSSMMVGPLPTLHDNLLGHSLFSSLSSLANSHLSFSSSSPNIIQQQHPNENDNNNSHSTSTIMNQNNPCLKKSSSSSTTTTQHKVEYTFSISTPDTLRSRQKNSKSSSSPSSASSNSSTSNLNSKPPQSPVELVRLYPNEPTATTNNPPIHLKNSDHESPKSPTPSISSHSSASSIISTPITMACQTFCDKLQEVCSNSFDHLLSEPLFDLTTGSLNESILITNDHDINNNNNNNNNSKNENENDMDISSSSTSLSSSSEKKYLSSQEIWNKLSQHSQFRQYSIDQLLKMVKSLAKCTPMGPVLTEQDIHFIMDKMNQGIL
ncbi:hypothetical protein BJ944DRAFT_266437 [Cunninghamella echinulata]|nr:hypothetical protein BJ944DRAFT_266437 [Cunninghamella echinulata]